MMVEKLANMGITSKTAYAAGAASVGLSAASWLASKTGERDTARADRWGIFVGLWAPTFFGLGNALKLEETRRR